MPTTTSAFASLLPLVGAAALTVQGIRRLRAGRNAGRATLSAPPRPIEVPDPERPRPRSRTALPDGACTCCGTSIPARETLCTACERKSESATNSAATTALHWLVFVAVMTAIIGGGWLLSP